jgi:A/G-specific adenine glycosylase
VRRGELVLAWFDEHQRDLPWRHTDDPYRILVSEVMLQQTPVARVVPAYERFVERFPTAAALAVAPLDEVLAAWQGLGYPVRARRLRETAQIVTDRGWPRTSAELTDLPGIGPYTAAAVASFAFGEQVAAVDTNVRRVVSRWRGESLSGAKLSTAATEEMTGEAAAWNQAVMELGALVCRAAPNCDVCPVVDDCEDPSIYLPPPPQGRYEGSIRQMRGDLLRVLDAGPIALDDLLEHSGDRSRARKAIAGLETDGLVTTAGGIVTIEG